MPTSPRYPLQLSVQFADKAPAALTRNRLRRWVQAALQQPAQLTLRFVDRCEGQALNASYRGKDDATNVLTFPYHEPNDTIASADIVICTSVVADEARQQKKLLWHHYAHMIVHGVLHAQGLDHLTEVDAAVMEAREIAVLQRLRVPNPYAEIL